MKILIVAVFLAVMQATPPVPAKTPDSRTEASSNGPNQSQKNKTESNNHPSPLQFNASPEHDRQADDNGDAHTGQSVIISKLPAVSVTRDFADWFSLALNGLLVVVGFLTLGAVWSQSKEMARATKAMNRSTEALVKSVGAWVMVNIEPEKGTPKIDISQEDAHRYRSIDIKYICRNEGKSFATITEKGYVLKTLPAPLPQNPDFKDIEIIDHACDIVAPMSTAETHHFPLPCDLALLRGPNMIVFYGRVKYTDVYGEYETRFGYQITGMGNLERLPVRSYPKYNDHEYRYNPN